MHMPLLAVRLLRCRLEPIGTLNFKPASALSRLCNGLLSLVMLASFRSLAIAMKERRVASRIVHLQRCRGEWRANVQRCRGKKANHMLRRRGTDLRMCRAVSGKYCVTAMSCEREIVKTSRYVIARAQYLVNCSSTH